MARAAQRILLPLVAGLTLVSVASCGPRTQSGSTTGGGSSTSSALPGTTGSRGSTTNPGATGAAGQAQGGNTEGMRLNPGDEAGTTGVNNRTGTDNVTANSGADSSSTLSGSASKQGMPRGSGESGGSAGQPAPLGLAGASTPTIGLGSSPAVATPEVAGASARQATIEITPENGSDISGTATLSDLGNGRTRVLLTVTGSTGDHPAHIHDGACPDVNPAPKWPLNDVQNGSSTTEVDASLDNIMAGATAINVHTSPQDDTAVACGTINPAA